MGCDIHMFKEKKIDGKWLSVDTWVQDPDEYHPHVEVCQFDSERGYAFFTALAGVRGRGVQLHFSDMPPDVSPEVKAHYELYWGYDGHTPGHITKAEAVAHGGPYFQDLIKNLEDDERCVFWFDN